MKKTICTSVSLPESHAKIWQKNRKLILAHAERFMRMAMRKTPQRESARKYNRVSAKYTIVNVRFDVTVYKAFTYAATSLRVSVSSLIYQLINLWLKPARRKHLPKFCANYSFSTIVWDPMAGIIEEGLTFWRIEGTNPNTLLPSFT